MNGHADRGSPVVVVPDALRDVTDPILLERVTGRRATAPRSAKPQVVEHGRHVPIRACEATAAEFEATMALLANGGYRPAFTPTDGTLSNHHDEMVERLPVRLGRMIDRVLRSKDRSDDGALHAPSIQWRTTVPHLGPDEGSTSRAGLRRIAAATARGRMADASSLQRIDEAIDTLAALHIEGHRHAACSLPTPWSPARVAVSDGTFSGTSSVPVQGALIWTEVEIDPDIASALPQVLVLDPVQRTDGSTAPCHAVLRAMHRTVHLDAGIDAMQALRILAELKRNPLT
jgi:hypothetical protein